MRRLRAWAQAVWRDVVALWLAARDARTPRHAKLVAGFVAAYALSPIDLIPDFIPLVGQLDDLVIVPAGILLAIKLIPSTLLTEMRAEAERLVDRPVSRVGAAMVVGSWLAAALLLWAFWP